MARRHLRVRHDQHGKIRHTYGPFELEEVYGLSPYSEVEEKLVGVITVGGRLTFTMACNEAIVGDGPLLRDAVMALLKGNL